MQHEREPFSGIQRVEDHEQRETNRIGHKRFLLGIDYAVTVRDRRRELPRLQRLLTARLARAQQVEANPRDDGRQPAIKVRHRTHVGPADAQPRVLHGVVRLAQGTQHPEGHRPQMAPVGLELLCQPLALVRLVHVVSRSHSFVWLRHSSDARAPTNVTAVTRSAVHQWAARRVGSLGQRQRLHYMLYL